MTPKVLVLRTAGTNCDLETQFAFEKAGAETTRLHVNLATSTTLKQHQVLVFPGGFTYGDDISAGKIMANEVLHRFKEPMLRFIEDGKLMLGICNGFQILVKAGLLPALGGYFRRQEVTLAFNDSNRFEDRWICLKPTSKTCVFTKGMEQVITLPIAHAEGKFVPANRVVLNTLKKNDRIVFRYVDEKGKAGGFPVNPNGSIDHIAGVCDKTGRIMGLMPHPERHISYLQNPHHTRKNLPEEGAGMMIFRNAVQYVRENL